MLIVLARQSDAGAAKLVSDWHEKGALLLTADSLSERGWAWRPGSLDDSHLVIDGCRLPVRAVRGVVSLLHAIDPGELRQIVPEEREYVAGEMTAFLVAWLTWLSDLGVRVMNRPTPLSLAGPALHREQWLQAAWHVGLPIRPAHRLVRPLRSPAGARRRTSIASPPEDHAPPIPIPVIGGRCLPGPDGQQLAEPTGGALGRLAAAVGAEQLTALLVESSGQLLFSDAVPTVDVARAGVADALLQALGGAA